MTSLFPIKDPRIVTLGEHRTELGLTEEENQFLRDNGYEVMSLLGEGNTRRAYLARYLRGGIDKLRVVKIPKSEIDDETSPTTAINMSKGDLNIQEVSASNLISHPNIITTLDSLRLGSRTINVEEHFPESQDLESLVGIMGPLRDSSYDGIMGQVLDAVEYVNIEESMLLRDNKPSNVLVNKRGHVKLTDLQNAKRVVDVRELTLPTRGGTPYTHPRMLNAMLEGRLSKADLRSETYAVGGIGYFSSTGENPFGYKLIQDENGVPISVGGEEFRVAIQEDGKIKTRIDEEAHEKKLRRMVKILPRHRRDPIYRALTLDENKAYNDISQLKMAAKKKSGGFWRRVGEQVVKNIRPALIGGAIVGALGGLTLVGVNAPKEEEKPTLSQILRNQDYRDFSLEALDGEDKNYALALLQDDFEELRGELPGFLKTVRQRDQNVIDKWLDQHLPFLTSDAKFTYGDLISDYTNFANTIHYMDRRLVSSWLTANYMMGENYLGNFKVAGEDRIYPGMVPRNFVARSNPFGSNQAYAQDEATIPYGVMYLKQGIGRESTAAEVFAEFYCDNEEINTARVRTGSLYYLPRVNGNSLEIGYGRFLPYFKDNMIQRALALYMITDEDGNPQLDRINDLEVYAPNYLPRLVIPSIWSPP